MKFGVEGGVYILSSRQMCIIYDVHSCIVHTRIWQLGGADKKQSTTPGCDLDWGQKAKAFGTLTGVGTEKCATRSSRMKSQNQAACDDSASQNLPNPVVPLPQLPTPATYPHPSFAMLSARSHAAVSAARGQARDLACRQTLIQHRTRALFRANVIC